MEDYEKRKYYYFNSLMPSKIYEEIDKKLRDFSYLMVKAAVSEEVHEH